MKSLYPRSGYTIVETMIFLTVSLAFFGTVVGAWTQQNNRTQFTKSVETLQDRLQDVLNDVGTGYYPSSGNFTCTFGNSGPTINPGSREQGTNKDCIFVGRAFQFAPQGVGVSSYNLYTMVGNRLIAPNDREASALGEAKPQLLGVPSSRPGIVERGDLISGLEIKRVVMLKDTPEDIGGFAVYSDFATTNPVGNTRSGNSSRVSIGAIKNTSLNILPTDFANNIYAGGSANVDVAHRGILICLQEGGLNGRKATITIGASGQFSLDRTIDEWPSTGECGS